MFIVYILPVEVTDLGEPMSEVLVAGSVFDG